MNVYVNYENLGRKIMEENDKALLLTLLSRTHIKCHVSYYEVDVEIDKTSSIKFCFCSEQKLGNILLVNKEEQDNG